MAVQLFTLPRVLILASLLRLVLLLYGLAQDAFSPLKYTDIDYFVFTDAARYVSRGKSPYARETYRYTPLLAWILLPTTWNGTAWFSFGKVLFGVADVVAGWLMVLVLRDGHGRGEVGMDAERALKYASIWLLNPMVATISTRGSSEGLLGVMVVALLWAVTKRRIALAGILLGIGMHFKIYPFIYGPSIVWYLENHAGPAHLTDYSFSKAAEKWVHDRRNELTRSSGQPLQQQVLSFFNRQRITLVTTSLLTFIILNASMYALYGRPFLQETYLHHLSRIDHRHNFSPYNTLLYLSSANAKISSSPMATGTGFLSTRLESFAFFPQLLLSAVIIPLCLAKHSLPGAMMASTFAFVTFNKVCTSQYFLWYMSLIPFYLPNSSFLAKPTFGLIALGLWVGAQGLWLQQGYLLEFLGLSTFFPGLWIAGVGFFGINCWILGYMIDDIGARGQVEENKASSQYEALRAGEMQPRKAQLLQNSVPENSTQRFPESGRDGSRVRSSRDVDTAKSIE